MNRRDFLKKAGAAVALAATGIEAKAMVPPYPWPGEPPREPVEGLECGKHKYQPGDITVWPAKWRRGGYFVVKE